METLSYMNEEIAKRVDVSEDSPSVIVAVAPCRSGTTAQLRVFAEAGVESHYQPLKAIMRELQESRESRFVLPDNEKTVFLKETVGPYTEEESTLDPVGILLKAGVPPEKLHLLAMMRQPLVTFASWVQINDAVREFFGGALPTGELLENAILSYRTVHAIRRRAVDAGIKTTTFVQEALRDNSPEKVVRALLSRARLEYNPKSVTGWRELTPIGDPGSGVIFHPAGSEPTHDEGTRRVHDALLKANGLMFMPKEDEELYRRVSSRQQTRLEEAGLYDLYEEFREACENDLAVTVTTSKEPVMPLR